MKISAIGCALLLALSSCASTQTGPVIGRLQAPGIAPAYATVHTISMPGGGVKVATDIGRGQRAVAITAYDTDRLIVTLNRTVAQWSRKSSSPPFRETLMGGSAEFSGQNPFLVELLKTEEMSEPIVLVTVGYRDAAAALALDKSNTRNWMNRLREKAGYSR